MTGCRQHDDVRCRLFFGCEALTALLPTCKPVIGVLCSPGFSFVDHGSTSHAMPFHFPPQPCVTTACILRVPKHVLCQLVVRQVPFAMSHRQSQLFGRCAFCDEASSQSESEPPTIVLAPEEALCLVGGTAHVWSLILLQLMCTLLGCAAACHGPASMAAVSHHHLQDSTAVTVCLPPHGDPRAASRIPAFPPPLPLTESLAPLFCCLLRAWFTETSRWVGTSVSVVNGTRSGATNLDRPKAPANEVHLEVSRDGSVSHLRDAQGGLCLQSGCCLQRPHSGEALPNHATGGVSRATCSLKALSSVWPSGGHAGDNLPVWRAREGPSQVPVQTLTRRQQAFDVMRCPGVCSSTDGSCSKGLNGATVHLQQDPLFPSKRMHLTCHSNLYTPLITAHLSHGRKACCA